MPCPATGRGTTEYPLNFTRHTSLPVSGSNPCTTSLPTDTSWSFPFTGTTSGVLNENGFAGLASRGVVHAVLPVEASRATTCCLSVPSMLNTSLLWARTGLPPLPWTGA